MEDSKGVYVGQVISIRSSISDFKRKKNHLNILQFDNAKLKNNRNES